MKKSNIMTKCVHSIDPLCCRVEHMCEESIVIIGLELFAVAPYDQTLHQSLQILYKSIQKCVKCKYSGAWTHTSFSLNNFKYFNKTLLYWMSC